MEKSTESISRTRILQLIRVCQNLFSYTTENSVEPLNQCFNYKPCQLDNISTCRWPSASDMRSRTLTWPLRSMAIRLRTARQSFWRDLVKDRRTVGNLCSTKNLRRGQLPFYDLNDVAHVLQWRCTLDDKWTHLKSRFSYDPGKSCLFIRASLISAWFIYGERYIVHGNIKNAIIILRLEKTFQVALLHFIQSFPEPRSGDIKEIPNVKLK